MMTKAMLCGLAGFMVFFLVWVRRLTGPWRFNAAIGVNVYKYGEVRSTARSTVLDAGFDRDVCLCLTLLGSGATA